MKRLVLILFVVLASPVAHAKNSQKPVFLKAKCDGKLSSILLSAYKDAISTSPQYRLIPTLDDDGRMDVVFDVEMICTERNNFVAVASVYGLAKCVGTTNCHQSMDSSSLNVLLCDPNGEAQCGRKLLKEFEFYLSHANMQSMELD